MRSDVEVFEWDDDVPIVERVAAVDVAKASGMVCTRVPHALLVGRRVTKVWQVAATTNAILELACWACRGWYRACRDRIDVGLLACVLVPVRSGRVEGVACQRA